MHPIDDAPKTARVNGLYANEPNTFFFRPHLHFIIAVPSTTNHVSPVPDIRQMTLTFKLPKAEACADSAGYFHFVEKIQVDNK